jgi:hypothetical protein
MFHFNLLYGFSIQRNIIIYIYDTRVKIKDYTKCICLFITIGVCDPWHSPTCKKQNTWVNCEIDELKCDSTNEEGELYYFLILV